MWIKITLKIYFLPIRLEKIRNYKTVLVKVCEKNTLMHCWKEHKLYSSMRFNLAIPVEIKKHILFDPAIPLLGVYPTDILHVK